jgi:hypothetical protein
VPQNQVGGSGIEKRVQGLFDKVGVWMFLALVSLCIFQFQGLEKRVQSTELAVSGLQEGKVSRAELKDVQQSILRELSGSRNDFKNSIDTFRNDMGARLDLIIMNSKDRK